MLTRPKSSNIHNIYIIYTPLHSCPPLLKQCYSSSTPRPFSSRVFFAFTSSTDGKWFPSVNFTLVYRKKSQDAKSANMKDVQILECVYPDQKGVASWGIVLMQHPFVVFPEIRSLLPQNLSHCLFVNIHHVCNHSHTQTSILLNNLTDFLNVLASFQGPRVTWIVNHLPLLPDPH